MIEDKAKQGTIAWRRAHLGIPTASDFDEIMPTKTMFEKAEKKGEPPAVPATREKYMYKKVVERVLGKPWDSADGQTPTISQLFAVKRGRDLEDKACASLAIEMHKHQIRGKLRRCGMFMTDDRKIGASPDRMLVINGKEEPCEVKCVLAHNHVEYLLTDIANPDLKYYAQIQGQMAICGAMRAHFYAYHDRMPGRYVMFERDEAYIGKLMLQLREFCVELDSAEKQLRTLGGFRPYGEREQ